MNYSNLLQTFVWTAVAGRHMLSLRRFGAAGTFVLALAVGAGLLSVGGPTHAQGAAVPTAAGAVNINSADAEALAAGLSGVGPARAKEIVRYRESYGPFSSVEELAEVQGISKATLDKNRNSITLE